MKAHVGLQRFMKQTVWRGQQPKKWAGRNQFCFFVSGLHPSQKRQLRRIFTCLKVNNLLGEDYKISEALKTKKEQKYHQCRVKARNKARKCFGSIRPGHVVHHRDLNACNNRCENLRLMSDRNHRKLHKTHTNCDKICQCFRETCQ